MDILNEVFTERTRQTRHLELASSPGWGSVKVTYWSVVPWSCHHISTDCWSAKFFRESSPKAYAVREYQSARFLRPAMSRHIRHELSEPSAVSSLYMRGWLAEGGWSVPKGAGRIFIRPAEILCNAVGQQGPQNACCKR
jgi:hypothetical protein